jgi:hypothetical protein
MARFNKTTRGFTTKPNAINLAGGTEAFAQSPQMELISHVLTSFVKDKFYRTAEKGMERVSELVPQIDPVFVAKLAVFARRKYGMRSISHVLAVELGDKEPGEEWRRKFYKRVIRRVDDITEIMALWGSRHGKPWPNAMKRGFADAMGQFTPYQIAKYRGEGKAVSLVDVANLVHPRPSERNAVALSQLIKGTLRNTGTWESRVTAAGQEGGTKEEVAERKTAAWSDLLREGKLGYFALLRNIRNIIETNDGELCRLAFDGLVNKTAIRKSLVLPFRFFTAYTEIAKLHGRWPREFLGALDRAANTALENVPTFEGRSLVVLDTSSSMTSGQVKRADGKESSITPAQIGALFAAVLYKANDADMMTFDSSARYVTVPPTLGPITLAQGIHFRGGGTDFRMIFAAADRKYDRAFILSDMQGWMGTDTWGMRGSSSQALKTLKDYRRRTEMDTKVFSFDLQGYGTMQFPDHEIYCVAGWSEKIFDVLKVLEQDKLALIREIEKVEL